MKKSNVVEITKQDTFAGKLVNSLQSTLRRMQGLLGYGISPDGKRNYNTVFGYQEFLSYTDYFSMYERNEFGSIIVDKLVKACWNEIPKIKTGDTEILEDEMKQLKKMKFFKALERADILNRIGNFSVLLVGMPDDQELDKPVGLANNIQGMYFNPYNYDGIEIISWDTDPESQRFNLPVMYQLQTTNHDDKRKDVNISSVNVHYSRVIHLAEGALDSSIEGKSSLKAPWNALINTLKVTGGCGEAYFRNARQQLALEADKDARLEKGSEALEALKQNLEDHHNGWDPAIRLQNMTAKNLQIDMISPRDSYDVNVESISGQTGIPIRILTGKGGGQTTGSEDRASWNSLIIDRRSSECDDYLMRGLEIMAEAGMFELPNDAIIEWLPQVATTDKEQSEVRKNNAEAFKFTAEAFLSPIVDEANAEKVFEIIGFEGIEIDISDIPPPEPVKPGEKDNAS